MELRGTFVFCTDRPVGLRRTVVFCTDRPVELRRTFAFCADLPVKLRRTVVFCVEPPVKPRRTIVFERTRQERYGRTLFLPGPPLKVSECLLIYYGLQHTNRSV